jgi:hypothetical protein
LGQKWPKGYTKNKERIFCHKFPSLKKIHPKCFGGGVSPQFCGLATILMGFPNQGEIYIAALVASQICKDKKKTGLDAI